MLVEDEGALGTKSDVENDVGERLDYAKRNFTVFETVICKTPEDQNLNEIR